MKRTIAVMLVLAMAVPLVAGCSTTQAQTTTGAVVGSAAGAIIGYQTGDNRSERQRNAVIGGALGGLGGGYVGHEMSMTKFCPTCGRQYGADESYCSVDGATLRTNG
jgi:uncharacterized protein YcfJ